MSYIESIKKTAEEEMIDLTKEQLTDLKTAMGWFERGLKRYDNEELSEKNFNLETMLRITKLLKEDKKPFQVKNKLASLTPDNMTKYRKVLREAILFFDSKKSINEKQRIKQNKVSESNCEKEGLKDSSNIEFSNQTEITIASFLERKVAEGRITEKELIKEFSNRWKGFGRYESFGRALAKRLYYFLNKKGIKISMEKIYEIGKVRQPLKNRAGSARGIKMTKKRSSCNNDYTYTLSQEQLNSNEGLKINNQLDFIKYCLQSKHARGNQLLALSTRDSYLSIIRRFIGYCVNIDKQTTLLDAGIHLIFNSDLLDVYAQYILNTRGSKHSSKNVYDAFTSLIKTDGNKLCRGILTSLGSYDRNYKMVSQEIQKDIVTALHKWTKAKKKQIKTNNQKFNSDRLDVGELSTEDIDEIYNDIIIDACNFILREQSFVVSLKGEEKDLQRGMELRIDDDGNTVKNLYGLTLKMLDLMKKDIICKVPWYPS
ncbi:MAG: hypothetical protein HQK54_18010, partial [Oligoflexales bacterium]|nr:hypothetical protein [Oligoflexales bacterium]